MTRYILLAAALLAVDLLTDRLVDGQPHMSYAQSDWGLAPIDVSIIERGHP